MKYYIYIIHSEQFPANHYKIGFTVNPKRRINDSSYTTTYIEPCIYKYIWELEGKYIDGRKFEQKLHAVLSDRSAYIAGKNKCKEMYKTDLEWLFNSISKIIQVSHIINIEEFLKKFTPDILNNSYYEKEQYSCPDDEANEIDKIKYNILTLSYNINLSYSIDKQKCACCGRKNFNHCHTVLFEDQSSYMLGGTCLVKLFGKRSEKHIKNIVYQQFKHTDQNINVIYKFITNKLDDNNKSEIAEISEFSTTWRMLEDRLFEEKFECKCNILYALKILFEKFHLSKNYYCIPLSDLNEPILNKYKDIILSFSQVYVTDAYWLYDLNRKKQYNSILAHVSNVKNVDYISTTYKNKIMPTDKALDYYMSNIYDNKDLLYENMIKFATKSFSLLIGPAGCGKTMMLCKYIASLKYKKKVGIFCISGKASCVIKDQLTDAYYKLFIGKTGQPIYPYYTPNGNHELINLIRPLYNKSSLPSFQELLIIIENCKKKLNFILDDDDEITRINENMLFAISNCYTIDMAIINNRLKNCESYDIIILDEAGMIDLYKLSKIIELNHMQLILAGDDEQLPPIGSLSLLPVIYSKIAEEKFDNITELKYNYRAENEKELIDMFNLVRKKKNMFGFEDIKDFSKYHRFSDASFKITLKNILSCLGDTEEFRILVSTNEERKKIFNTLDIKNYSDDFITTINNKKCIMCLENKYEYDSDDKKILKYYNGQNVINLEEFKSKELKIERCEVMTIHKSQGSTIKNVILVINKPITHNSFYTAITRTSKNLFILVNENINKLIKEIDIQYNELLHINNDKFNFLFMVFRAISIDIGINNINNTSKPNELFQYLTNPKMSWVKNRINEYFRKVLIKRIDLKNKILEYYDFTGDLYSLFCNEYRKLYS